MYEKLMKMIKNLGSPRIMVVGDFMLDIYTYGDAMRISPEAPVPVLKVTQTDSRCGGAAAVAADVAGLGGTPVCIGIIGQDREGQILRDKLTDLRMDTSGLYEAPLRPTTTKQRIIGLAQHRHKQQLMRIDREVIEPFPSAIINQILQHYSKCLTEVDIICLQDYNKGLLTNILCQKMIGLAQEAGIKVLIDPTARLDYSLYRGATVLKPNRREAATAVGFPINTPSDAAKAAQKLRHELGLNAVVITLDKQGACLSTKDFTELIPAIPRNVYDVTGAGDMVLATLAVSLAANIDYRSVVQLAIIASGIEVQKFGTTTVTIPEIVHEIIQKHSPKSPKLRSLEELLKELGVRRSQGQSIVFTNGCFDLIHRGHIKYLDFCRDQGDVVVVGLNSDTSVRALKGPQRPINNQYDRAAVLSGLETVDLITIFDDASVLNLVKSIKPDILIKGGNWGSKQGIVGWEFVESYGGKVMLAPLVEGKSSTCMIEKIKGFEDG